MSAVQTSTGATPRRRTLDSLRSPQELGANRPHGTRTRYAAGCHCDECRRANTEYERVRSAARKAGDWNGFVSADRARAHLQALQAANVGRRQIADASGVAQTIIAMIRSGDRRQIRGRTERAILAVTPAAAADYVCVDAGPTWQLLDALLATGYTKAQLAAELGYRTPALQLRRDKVLVRNAYEVERLHARLRRVPARETQKLIAELRAEGYRPERIQAMASALAARVGAPAPDLQVYGKWISAAAADLVQRLHAEVTEEPA